MKKRLISFLIFLFLQLTIQHVGFDHEFQSVFFDVQNLEMRYSAVVSDSSYSLSFLSLGAIFLL